MAPWTSLGGPEGLMTAGLSGLLLSQQRPLWQQPQQQGLRLAAPPQQPQRQQRLPPVAAFATAAPPLQQLPAFFGGLFPARAGPVPHPLLAEASQGLPPALYRLLDPGAPVELPPCGAVAGGQYVLDNRELDKLVAGLGRSKATWRRALMLHQWLQACGHAPDARLATTLIRVCSQHGQALAALGLYDWMRAGRAAGGGSLTPTVFTYTAAMRAALAGNLLPRAFQVWEDARADGCEPDCRMATTLIEVCARAGNCERALATYDTMKVAQPGSRMAPSVHAYTAAMRAAAEGGRWQRALDIWDDMARAGCRPTGHAFAAVISACAAGGDWRHGAALFDEMRGRWGIKPDVVSCTALVTAFGTDGQWSRAQQVVDWMHTAGIRPNVRTYTALVGALGRGGEWTRAQRLLRDMRRGQPWGGTEPNAYTYSALLKAMGEQGRWQLAEQVFAELEAEALGRLPASSSSPSDANAASHSNSGNADSSDSANLWSAALDASPLSLPDLRSMSFGGLGGDAAMSGSDEACSTPVSLHRSGSSGGFNPLESYGLLPTSLAEQVLDSPAERQALAASLPDDLPGQSNSGASFADGCSASFPEPGALHDASSSFLGADAAPWEPSSQTTVSQQQQNGSSVAPPQASGNSAAAARQGGKPGRSPLNEVVVGATMLAFERAGQVDKCVGMLDRARRLGITPNTVMLNTAMAALGKSGRASQAAALFAHMPAPDTISHETLIAAHGMAGDAAAAEAVMSAMIAAGHTPRDYAFCGLISAYSLAGDWRSALSVRHRMLAAGAAPSVHAYNALIAAADRGGQWDAGLQLHAMMVADGCEPNAVTQQLLSGLGRGGAAHVSNQQAVVTALTAAVAAAGSMLIQTGAF